jgi:hypothetical protein
MRRVALAIALLASAATASAAFASTGKSTDVTPNKAHVTKTVKAPHHPAKVKVARAEHAAKKPAVAATAAKSPTK